MLEKGGKEKDSMACGRFQFHNYTCSSFIITPVPVHGGGAEDDKKENRRREEDVPSSAATPMAHNKPRPMMRKRKRGQVVWQTETGDDDEVDRGRSVGGIATTTMIGLVDSALPL